MPNQQHDFQLDFEVRDYECDLQGIVNNSVYQNYLEHTRHKFLKKKGLDFEQLTQQGKLLVVISVNIDYKRPLKSGDNFVVTLSVEKSSRLKFNFHQHIYRHPEELILTATVTGTSVVNGRPKVLDEVEQALFS